MKKMKMETKNITSENIEKIGELFPSVITEGRGEDGRLKKAINFELLKQLLSEDVLAGDEAFEFTWVGKKAAMLEAGKPIRKTLRPCVEESKHWETTENLYIEGDNLDVLKLLQESYLGKVRMIYIDPPYNTGNDFIYNDLFEMDQDEYDEQIGLFNEDRLKNFRQNSDGNPRFHSDWCSMMYPRLQLARNLLTEDGVIFISIDDNEQDNLKKLCSEIFGEKNFIACLPTITNLKGNQDQFAFAGTHEYTLVFCKNLVSANFNNFPIDEETLLEEWDLDEKGYFKRGANLKATGVNGPRHKRPNLFFPLYITEDDEVFTERQSESDIEIYPITNDIEMSWRWSKTKFFEEHSDVIVSRDSNNISLYKKQRPQLGDLPSKKPKSFLYKPEYSSGNGTAQFVEMFGNRIFNNPKPLDLINDLLHLGTDSNSVVIDFFSGSATTAHAVMQLNAEDGGKRKFIMVQLPELTDEKSEAYKAGYKTICEIGKERIRRAGEKIKKELTASQAQLKLGEEPKAVPDIGFRVLKLDESNMKEVFYAPVEYSQSLLPDLESNIREDRTDLDLLFGCLLEWGLPLSMPHTAEEIDGCTVHTYNEGDLIACFDERVPESVVREIAHREPLRVVFRDSSFASSPEKINVEEIFKLLAPNTSIQVL